MNNQTFFKNILLSESISKKARLNESVLDWLLKPIFDLVEKHKNEIVQKYRALENNPEAIEKAKQEIKKMYGISESLCEEDESPDGSVVLVNPETKQEEVVKKEVVVQSFVRRAFNIFSGVLGGTLSMGVLSLAIIGTLNLTRVIGPYLKAFVWWVFWYFYK